MDVVIQGLILGKTTRQIVEAMEKKHNLPPEATGKLITTAKKELSELYAMSIREHFHRTLTRLEHLWQKTYGTGDYTGALNVQKAIIGLLGLEAPKEMRISAEVNSQSVKLEIDQSRLDQLTVEERQQLLGTLLALAPTQKKEDEPPV